MGESKFVIVADQQVIGFFALTTKELETHLDHLWISPKWIGSGIGKAACSYIFDYCRELGIKEVVTYPDPPAEGFYLKQGF